MKNYNRLCLIIGFALFMTGCGNSANLDATDIDSHVDTSIVSEEENLPKNVITFDDFKKCFSTVELSVDNWNSYFEIVEEGNDIKDAFDEVTGHYEEFVIKPKEDAHVVSVEGGAVLRFEFDAYSLYNTYIEYPEGNKFHAFGSLTDKVREETDCEVINRSTQIFSLSESSIKKAETEISDSIVDDNGTPIEKYDIPAGAEYTETTILNPVDNNNIVCLKAKGNITIANIPESFWTKSSEDAPTDHGRECDYISVKRADGVIAYFYADGKAEVNSALSEKAMDTEDAIPEARWDLSVLD